MLDRIGISEQNILPAVLREHTKNTARDANDKFNLSFISVNISLSFKGRFCLLVILFSSFIFSVKYIKISFDGKPVRDLSLLCSRSPLQT